MALTRDNPRSFDYSEFTALIAGSAIYEGSATCAVRASGLAVGGAFSGATHRFAGFAKMRAASGQRVTLQPKGRVILAVAGAVAASANAVVFASDDNTFTVSPAATDVAIGRIAWVQDDGKSVVDFDAAGEASQVYSNADGTALLGPDGLPISLGSSGQCPASFVKVGSFGDSIADIGGVNNVAGQGIVLADAAFPITSSSTEKFGGWLSLYSGGLVQPVFNGGVGGETSTQIAARAAGAESATQTSKSLLNAQLFGCDFLVVSMSVNDFTGFNTGTAQATLDAAIATALANFKTVFKKAGSLGIYTIFHSVLPYGTSGSVTANQAVINTTTAEYNRQAQAYLAGLSGVASYYDARTMVEAAGGGWTDALTFDGMHPNHAGCIRMYAELAALIKRLSGIGSWRNALPKAKNMFSNADLSLSAAGLATGIAVAVVDGTTTRSIVEVNGVPAQEFVWTPGNIDGTDSRLFIDVIASAAGASPYVSVSIGDVLGFEFDLLVDNNAGGAPNVFNLSTSLRKAVGLTPTIYNTVIGWPTGSSTQYFLDNVEGKLAGGYIKIDEATGASSGSIFSRIVLTSKTQTTAVRLRISNIRVVKLPSGYLTA